MAKEKANPITMTFKKEAYEKVVAYGERLDMTPSAFCKYLVMKNIIEMENKMAAKDMGDRFEKRLAPLLGDLEHQITMEKHTGLEAE